MTAQLRAEGFKVLMASIGISVFPCIPGTKIPITPHGFRDPPEVLEAALRDYPRRTWPQSQEGRLEVSPASTWNRKRLPTNSSRNLTR
jgi:hypothetical protein